MSGAMLSTATPLADWLVVLPVVLPLVVAGLLLALRQLAAVQAAVAALAVAAVALSDLLLLRRVLVEGPLVMTMGNWLPPFGISFAADATGAAFAFVAALVTLLVLLYMQGSGPDPATRAGGYSLVLLLLAGVSGAFLTGDLFNLYVWFEVMLIASFGLFAVGAGPLQVDAALKYGFLNFLATTLFLAALGVLYALLGTLNMADIARVAPAAEPAAVAAVAGLLLVAFGIKAAAFPLNAWLPASYHAASPAFSALMAGLLTKVGVYALLRALVVLLPAAHELLRPLLAAIAIATLLLAPLGALAETNLRRAIGFFVIGGVGAIFAGMAMPGAGALAGSVFYVLHAMLAITALYMVAGLVERAAGETDTVRIGAVYRGRPAIPVLFLVLVLAVAGVPPFLGFWPKLLLLQAGFASVTAEAETLDPIAVAVSVALLVNAFLTLAAGIRLWSFMFWRRDETAAAPPPTVIRFGFSRPAAMLMVAMVLAAGLWPETLVALARHAGQGLADPAGYFAAFRLGGLP